MVGVTQNQETLGFTKYLGLLSPVKKKSPTNERYSFFPSEGSDTSSGDEQGSAGFDVADELEKGFAEEGFAAKNMRHPGTLSNRLARCSIVYQESCDEYHLMSEDLNLMMAARLIPQEKRIEFYGPCEQGPSSRMSGTRNERRRPAFTMGFGEDTDELTLVQTRCECCAHRPRHLTCEYFGKGQQVALIKHSRRTIGDKMVRVHNLDVHVPPLVNGTKSAVWCPVFTGKDLGSRSPSSPSSNSSSKSASPTRRRFTSEFHIGSLLPTDQDEPLKICTRLPEWDKEVESLVLNFKDRRNLCSSPRNFMLEYGCGKDAEIVLQHAQNGKSTWCLDYKHPLSAVQAFAIAMASIEWD